MRAVSLQRPGHAEVVDLREPVRESGDTFAESGDGRTLRHRPE